MLSSITMPVAEVQHQVHEEECVRDNVEHNLTGPWSRPEEGDAHRDDDEVSHHEEQHGKVPVEPGGEAYGSRLHLVWGPPERLLPGPLCMQVPLRASP